MALEACSGTTWRRAARRRCRSTVKCTTTGVFRTTVVLLRPLALQTCSSAACQPPQSSRTPSSWSRSTGSSRSLVSTRYRRRRTAIRYTRRLYQLRLLHRHSDRVHDGAKKTGSYTFARNFAKTKHIFTFFYFSIKTCFNVF